MNISNNLKQFRELHNLTQKELGIKLNLTRQTISKWETGKSLPDIENLAILSDIYKISIDQLIGRKDILNNSIDIKNKNKRKEVFRMITKQATMMLVTIGILLSVFIGKGALDQHVQNTIDKKDGFVTLYGVKEVEYTNMSNPSISRGDLISLTLYSGDIIKPVTWKEIKEKDLHKKSKVGIADGYSDINYDGIPVNVSSLKDFP